MKMVVISLLVLLLFVGAWIWFYYNSVEPVTTYYWEKLIELSNSIYADDWQIAEYDMRNYFGKWKDTRNLWIYFINQNDIDNIDSSIRKLDSYIKNRDKNMAQAELEHLRVLFNVINENECLSLENIM
ncbi:MAG: DUF4363 family protein [Sedimentibacter sp.]|uniref:DUF4363 family protein n=1 Tax=Sedimentibacter sp. TaxID=1960295 RepID=UPI0029826F90|nr:DUF4363 family protein [Sedimentibacter sp.]MDW5299296.1 DUF4363 family protein [Sedimentibacter sp.]